MPTQFTTNVNAPYPQQGIDLLWGTTLNFMIVTYDIKFGSTFIQNLSNISPIVFPTSSIAGSYVPTQFSTIQFTGAMTSNIIIQFPVGVGGSWYIENFTTGAFDVTLQVGSGPAGTTYKPPQGFRTAIRSDGINIDLATNVPFWVIAPVIPTNTIIANTSGIAAQPLPVDPSTLKFTLGLNMNGGTFTALGGTVNMAGGGTIINLPDPVNPLDGANKEYVDNKISLIQSIPATVGLTIKNNPGSPNTQVDVVALSAQIVKPTSEWIVRTAISLTIDAATVGPNGLDAGSLAASTFYHVYLIDDGTTTAGLLSLSATTPTLPSGYVYFSRIGARITNGSSNFISVNQVKDTAQYIVPRLMASSTSTVSVTPFVPPTAIILRAMISAGPASDTEVTLGATSGNPILLIGSIAGSAQTWGSMGDIVLNSSNVFLTVAGGGGNAKCAGWVDNVLAS